jgi:hypothetical protein
VLAGITFGMLADKNVARSFDRWGE